MKILKAILCIIIILYLYCIINVEKYTVRAGDFYYSGKLTDPTSDSKPCTTQGKLKDSNLTCEIGGDNEHIVPVVLFKNNTQHQFLRTTSLPQLWVGGNTATGASESIKLSGNKIGYFDKKKQIGILNCGDLKLTYDDILYVYCMKPTGNLFLEDSIYIFLKTKYYTNQKMTHAVGVGDGSIIMKPHPYTENIFEHAGEHERIMKKIYWVQHDGDKLRLHYESEVVATLKTSQESDADVTAAVTKATTTAAALSATDATNKVTAATKKATAEANKAANAKFKSKITDFNTELTDMGNALIKFFSGTNREIKSSHLYIPKKNKYATKCPKDLTCGTGMKPYSKTTPKKVPAGRYPTITQGFPCHQKNHGLLKDHKWYWNNPRTIRSSTYSGDILSSYTTPKWDGKSLDVKQSKCWAGDPQQTAHGIGLKRILNKNVVEGCYCIYDTSTPLIPG